MTLLEESDETYAKSTLGGAQEADPTEEKVLGVKLDVSTDQLMFNVQEVATLQNR